MRHDHGLFLEKLLQQFRIALVNRYADDALGFDADPQLRVFIPDLHWITQERADKYPYYQFVSKKVFADLIRLLRDIENLEVFQTGDRLDFWRMCEPREMTSDEIYDLILGDSSVRDMNQGLVDVGAKIVYGNHDKPLSTLRNHPHEPAREDQYLEPGGRFFITHGHIWDQIERLPDSVQWEIVRIAVRHRAQTRDVGPFREDPLRSVHSGRLLRRGSLDRNIPIVLPRPGGAVPLERPADVAGIPHAYVPVDWCDDGAQSGINDFHKTSGVIAFGDAVRSEARKQGKKCRLFVMAHTHTPRIMVDRHPIGGGPLVTMDCGAWLEKSTIRGRAKEPSRHIGVQYGNDVRVYQLSERS
ncbi:MAG: hypothetical protein M3547_01455 [Acidobacteriota bacterium]|nr:hypothetical protein [Acidobacteriota bacterium]